MNRERDEQEEMMRGRWTERDDESAWNQNGISKIPKWIVSLLDDWSTIRLIELVQKLLLTSFRWAAIDLAGLDQFKDDLIFPKGKWNVKENVREIM